MFEHIKMPAVPQKSDSECDNSDNELENYTIDEMVAMSKKNQFPDKKFVFGNKITYYTPILHFYDSIQVFKNIINIIF